MQAQFNIRNNIQQMQDFQKSIADWSKEADQKDRQLRSSSQAASSSQPVRSQALKDENMGGAVPPVRGQAKGEVSGGPSGSRVMPPVRGQATRQGPGGQAAARPLRAAPEAAPRAAQKPQAAAGPASPTASRHPAGHIYDRAKTKWDQFDFEAALQDSDDSGDDIGGAVPTAGRQSQHGPPARPAARAPVDRPTAAPKPMPASKPASTHRQAPSPKAVVKGVTIEEEPELSDADLWRQRGNEAFKVDDFVKARRMYTQSIAEEPTAAAFSNRALANLKLEEYQKAEQDCTEALAADATFIKAWHRRGTARRAQGKLLEAAEDFEAALRLEPGSAALARDRQDTLKELMASEKLPAVSRQCRVPVHWADQPAVQALSSLQAGPAAAGISQGDDAFPAAQQQRTAANSERQANGAPPAARRRSTAGADEEEGTADLLSRLAAAQGAPGSDKAGSGKAAAPAAAPRAAAPLAQPISKQTAVASSLAGAHVQPGTAPDSATLSAEPPGSAASVPAQVSRAPVASGSSPAAMRTGAAPQQQAPPLPVAAAQAEPLPGSGAAVPMPQQGLPSPQNGRSPLDVASAVLQQAGSRSQAKLAPPRTGTEFDLVWKTLKGQPETQAAYIQLLDPAGLPALFKQSLTPAVLSSLLSVCLQTIASKPDKAPAAVQLLEGLTKVSRFEMTAMCLPKREKADLRLQWDAATASDAAVAPQLGALRTKYRL